MGCENIVVQLKNVKKVIRKVEIIHDMNAEFYGGHIYGLKGYNGSGKTMLMRLIAGLILPSSGEVVINGNVIGRDITFPDSIGILIENPAFLDSYTGFQNMKLLADIKGKIGIDEINEMLIKVGLDPEDKRKYRKYSLGMKQRLGICSSIMEHEDILLIDEPTNALDTDGVALVKNLLLEEKKRGALIIIACHEIDTLQMLSDEIYTIEKGTFVDHVVCGEHL